MGPRAAGVFALVLLASCGGGPPSGSPPEDSPASCSVSTLDVTRDGVRQESGAAQSYGTPNELMLTGVATAGDSYDLVDLRFVKAPGGGLTLPDAAVDVSFERIPNGVNAQGLQISTASETENVLPAKVTGTVDFVKTGSRVGETRCGSFDLLLDYTDKGSSHELRAKGSFYATLEADPEPG